MNKSKRIVVVKFEGTNRNYDFFNTDASLKEGDSVLCDTALGMSVGKVRGFKEHSPHATKFIIQRVDLQEFEVNKKKLRDKERMWRNIQNHIAQMDELEKVQYLSLHDAHLNVLFDSYKRLDKEIGC